MAKTNEQLEAERIQRIEERRQLLMKFPEVYRRDFDKAFHRYLQRAFPEVDPNDCDVLFDPDLRKGFITGWPEEAQELSRTYHLVPVWDPDGEAPPDPGEEGAARYIRCQDEQIRAKQITSDSISNLPPHKVLGRFLLAEIDLKKPRREIAASFMALVDQKRKHLQVSEDQRELVNVAEPRNRDESYIYKKLAVWQMVEKLRGNDEEDEKVILSKLAEEICKKQGWDKSYGDFKDDPETEDKLKTIRKALKIAFERDRKLYFGE